MLQIPDMVEYWYIPTTFTPLLCIDESDGIETPIGLAVDPEGYLFVAQSSGPKQKKARTVLPQKTLP